MIDMVVEWEKQGHISLDHCVFDLTVIQRIMGEKKTCIYYSHLQCQEVFQKCLLAFEFLACILVNEGLERFKFLKTAHFTHKKSHLCVALRL